MPLTSFDADADAAEPPARAGGVRYAVVVPTVGRPQLRATVQPLLAGGEDAPEEVVVVDDRPRGGPPLPLAGLPGVRVLHSGGRGPAAARDLGWRATEADWIVFLDDDVRPGPDWTGQLVADLAGLPFYTAGSQGRLHVPPPAGRRPTDAERGTLALAGAAWITADMAYRRSVLAEVGGFDPRFTRAYREDTDLALRVLNAGYQLVRGRRQSTHPPVSAGFWYSVGRQRGNADDALMRRLHGAHWRERVGEPRGRLPWHVLTSGVLTAATAAGALSRRSPAARRAAAPLAAAWLALTADFARRRIAPGPRTPAEAAAMAATSALIPPVACVHRLAGEVRHRRARPHRPPAVRAILFDRDGTLVRDVPYNGDPDRVRPTRSARAALERARRAGVRVGVVSNQSGIARGLLTRAELAEVNARVEELLGPFDTWQVCVHAADDGCRCRKPAPGLVEAAAAELGVRPADCVVIGDIGSDLEAARAAGARGILVPNPATRPEEVELAPEMARTVADAVGLALTPAEDPDALPVPARRTWTSRLRPAPPVRRVLAALGGAPVPGRHPLRRSARAAAARLPRALRGLAGRVRGAAAPAAAFPPQARGARRRTRRLFAAVTLVTAAVPLSACSPRPLAMPRATGDRGPALLGGCVPRGLKPGARTEGAL
ncbi:HAD-IIIA family hydrolase [Marinitenerispora sediminis]|uniref:D,D-heptose 1,7-bisphosphate phosphatase n=1 Tax=Marinitenerispora sediminis TaxID=1931232 RepID=A0A368SZ58_9ACTN|nr:HAD-IIIA family hydrolase [Marinitenerispora sediminis]RCV48833.1 HAD family hydrolase [Marinitenerispora sediminis]RCV49548.1 HAD family hydrolase [Marinitenerispora sediminis]RCV50564.1 HAD family hydrolase [Marinitenerispora sediminis]